MERKVDWVCLGVEILPTTKKKGREEEGESD